MARKVVIKKQFKNTEDQSFNTGYLALRVLNTDTETHKKIVETANFLLSSFFPYSLGDSPAQKNTRQLAETIEIPLTILKTITNSIDTFEEIYGEKITTPDKDTNNFPTSTDNKNPRSKKRPRKTSIYREHGENKHKKIWDRNKKQDVFLEYFKTVNNAYRLTTRKTLLKSTGDTQNSYHYVKAVKTRTNTPSETLITSVPNKHAEQLINTNNATNKTSTINVPANKNNNQQVMLFQPFSQQDTDKNANQVKKEFGFATTIKKNTKKQGKATIELCDTVCLEYKAPITKVIIEADNYEATIKWDETIIEADRLECSVTPVKKAGKNRRKKQERVTGENNTTKTPANQEENKETLVLLCKTPPKTSTNQSNTQNTSENMGKKNNYLRKINHLMTNLSSAMENVGFGITIGKVMHLITNYQIAVPLAGIAMIADAKAKKTRLLMNNGRFLVENNNGNIVAGNEVRIVATRPEKPSYLPLTNTSNGKEQNEANNHRNNVLVIDYEHNNIENTTNPLYCHVTEERKGLFNTPVIKCETKPCDLLKISTTGCVSIPDNKLKAQDTVSLFIKNSIIDLKPVLKKILENNYNNAQ